MSVICYCVFFFKQKTAYEMRISDWSSDVCSSDLVPGVTEVNSVGGYRKQYVVAPVPTRLAGFGLTVEDVIEALESNNANVGAGYVERSGSQYLIRVPGQAEDQGDLSGIIVAWREGVQIGRAHVLTPVTNAHLVCRLLL